MILRSVDGSVELVGQWMGIGIPASGDARYTLSARGGGCLDVSWLHSLCVGEQSGRVILVVGEDELVVTSPRTIRVSEDGTVALTLSEYVQASAALSAIPAKLGELEGRIAALEAQVGLMGAPIPGEVPTGEGTTYDPYEPGLNLCGEKE